MDLVKFCLFAWSVFTEVRSRLGKTSGISRNKALASIATLAISNTCTKYEVLVIH